MKLTKRLAAIAACACMAATSMVGMGASAASSHTTNARYIGESNGVKFYNQASISINQGTVYATATIYVNGGINVPKGTLYSTVGLFSEDGVMCGDVVITTQTSMANYLSSRKTWTAASGTGYYCGGITCVDSDLDGTYDIMEFTDSTELVR